MIFYHPNVDLSGFPNTKIVQHVDILKSTMEFLNITDYPQNKFGKSVFSPEPGVAYNFDGSVYWYIDQEGLVKINFKGDTTEYRPQGHLEHAGSLRREQATPQKICR